MAKAELVKCVYWDGELLAKADAYGDGLFGEGAAYPQPEDLYRLTEGGDVPRVYFKRNPVRTFASVTSIIKATTPTSPFLTKWIGQMGLRQAEQYRDARAAYGTLLHLAYGELLVKREFDLSRVQTYVDLYVKDNMLLFDSGTWTDELKAGLVGLAEFVQRYNVRPVAIEIPLASDKLGWAGSIDLVALMDVSPKKKNALTLIDFKSGDFHSEAETQVGAYKMLFNEAYPHAPISEVFLFGPKLFDEGSRDHYRMKRVTDSPLLGLMPNLLEQFKVRTPERAKVRELDGVIFLDSDPEVLIRFTSVESIIERTIQNEDIPQATHPEDAE